MSTPASRVPARHVAAVVVGNALEFYDFLTYAFFAVYIGRTFFPAADPATSLLGSLGTFGVGFVTRPIGGVVIGRMADRRGRKPAMILSFTLMGIAITGLALTPSYAAIGVAAPALVVLFRMLQGFALGGEVGPTTAFLLESAPVNRRGFYTCFQSWTQDLAILCAGLVGFVLSSVFSEPQLQAFGWRIAFLIGAAIIPFGLMMRRRLPETLGAHGGATERPALRQYAGIAVIGLLLLASATIGSYVCDYMTTYAIATLGMSPHIAFLATIVVGLTGVMFDLVGGALSDRFGRKPVMIVPAALLVVCILPAFSVITHYRTPAALLACTAVLSILLALWSGPAIVWLTESFPASMRARSVAVIYAAAIAVFGGSTQLMVTWLIRATGNAVAPGWYWTAAAAVGVAAMIGVRESAPRKLDTPTPRASR